MESQTKPRITRPLPQTVPAQSLDFNFLQPPPLAYWQSLIIERPDSCPAQLNNRMTNRIKHPANLLIAPLMKSHFKPRVRLNLTQLAHSSRRRSFALTNRDTPAQALDCTFRRDAFHFNFVDLGNSIPGGSDQICKISIIGEQ